MLKNPKKSSIILILNVLKEHSDQNHPLTQEKIISQIQKEYQVTLERKSISRNISMLSELNYNIEHTRDGYYLAERQFEESEVSYLIDAIFSSKSMNGKYARDLSQKILKTQSKYVQRKYSYVEKSDNVTRNINPHFFLNISLINEAIDRNNVISFNYLHYDENGDMIPKNDNYKYIVSPYYLVNNEGKYYLLASFYNEKIINPELTTFRIEYMRDIEINESIFRIDAKNVIGLGKSFEIEDYINSHIYMFNSEVINAKLLLKDIQVITAIHDTFGKNVNITKNQKGTIATIKCDEASLFYWCLQYNQSVLVLGPKKLREKMYLNLRSTLKKYEELNKSINEFPSKPKVVELIKDYINNLKNTYKSISNLSKDDIINDLTNYLDDNTMPNYQIIVNNYPNIIISNTQNTEKYAISIIIDNNYATDEKFLELIKNIKKLEQTKQREHFNQVYSLFITNNSSYNYTNENSLYFKYFQRKNTVPIDKNIEYKDENDKINLDNKYTISWKSIKFEEDGFYNYYILSI